MDDLQTVVITLTADEVELIHRLGFDTPGDFVRQSLDHILDLLDAD
jgi:hypothetical protein